MSVGWYFILFFFKVIIESPHILSLYVYNSFIKDAWHCKKIWIEIFLKYAEVYSFCLLFYTLVWENKHRQSFLPCLMLLLGMQNPCHQNFVYYHDENEPHRHKNGCMHNKTTSPVFLQRHDPPPPQPQKSSLLLIGMQVHHKNVLVEAYKQQGLVTLQKREG